VVIIWSSARIRRSWKKVKTPLVRAKALSREIVTDKAGQAPRGIERAFIHDSTKPKHTLIKTGAGYPNGNQWAERLNNTVRERTKIQRGWKADNTPLREGQRLYYNFIREIRALKVSLPQRWPDSTKRARRTDGWR
jgi:hypothetical protein